MEQKKDNRFNAAFVKKEKMGRNEPDEFALAYTPYKEPLHEGDMVDLGDDFFGTVIMVKDFILKEDLQIIEEKSGMKMRKVDYVYKHYAVDWKEEENE